MDQIFKGTPWSLMVTSGASFGDTVMGPVALLANRDKRMDGITFKYFREQSAEHILELDQQRRAAVSLAFPKSVTIPVHQGISSLE